MADSPFWAAIKTVKNGMSGRAGLAAARAGGVKIQDATWFRMVGEVRASLSSQIHEVTKPLNRKPLGDEIKTMTSRKATGFIQYVDIMVKDRDTGLTALRPYAVRVKELRSRQSIVKEALTRFVSAINDNPSDYDEQVLGAVYTATYQMNPSG